MNQDNLFFDQQQSKLPNATIALILSIVSFFVCCLYGLGGVLSGVALYLLSKDKPLLAINPNPSNLSTYKAAKVIAWITLIINILFIIYILLMISLIGWDNLTDPEFTSNPQNIIDLIQNR